MARRNLSIALLEPRAMAALNFKFLKHTKLPQYIRHLSCNIFVLTVNPNKAIQGYKFYIIFLYKWN